MTDPILFVFAVLVILATPGPTNTLLAMSGISVGLRRSLWLVPAELVGYLAAVLIIGLVAGPVLMRPPWSVALRIIVAVYLIVLAVRLWRIRIIQIETQRSISPRDVLVTTFFNPKASIFALVVIPMQQSVWPLYVAAFSVLVVSMSFAWIGTGGALKRGLFAGRQYPAVFGIGSAVIVAFAAVVIWPALQQVIGMP